MKKMLVALLLLCNSAFSFASLPAGSLPDPEYICPIDGEKFVLQGSPGIAYHMGTMLDLKPCSGDFSGRWPVPICPNSKFAMYRTFSEHEIERLREYVNTPEFIKLIQVGDVDHQIIATMRFLNEDADKIAFQLLSASWYRGEPSYSGYAMEALAAYSEILKHAPKDEKLWNAQQLVAGELERRLSLFEDARRRFLALQKSGRFDSADYAERIRLELRLIEMKNNETNSTNLDCRVEKHITFALPYRACTSQNNPDDESAKIADFCACRPPYPKPSILAEEDGEIAINFTVGSNNQLTNQKIVKSTGYKNLDQAALKGLASCKFQAARKRGRPIEGSFTEKFLWSLEFSPGTGEIQPSFEMH